MRKPGRTTSPSAPSRTRRRPWTSRSRSSLFSRRARSLAVRASMADELAERIRGLLEARGEDWPGPIESFAVIASTNDHVKELARTGAGEWSVAVAGQQTAGRGRQGSLWRSPPGNLALTVLLRPSLSASEAGLIPLAAGVAVRDALAEMGVQTALKWPNDITVTSRK